MKALTARIKVVLLSFALFISALSFPGCYYSGYRGDYPELCSVAWSNIPTLYGYTPNGEISLPPFVTVFETDSHGRVLFEYYEHRLKSCYIMIMQRADAERAYYYPDDCYLYIKKETENDEIDLQSREIADLKLLNDWDMPLDESKCESTEIVRKKQDGKLELNDIYFDDIVREYHVNSHRYIHPKNYDFVSDYKFVTSDHYGRELYAVYTYFDEYTDKAEIHYGYTFLIAVNPDKSYDPSTVIVLDDLYNTREAVRFVKENNAWNTPF